MTDDDQLIDDLRSEVDRYRQEIAQINHIIEEMIAKSAHELQLWTAIQRKLSPTEIPQFPGIQISTKFEPGEKSGGDYFEFFDVDDKMQLGLVVSSANGYGISSLMMSVLIKLTSRTETRKILPPDQVLQEIWNEIEPLAAKTDEASVLFGYLDRRTYEFRYCLLGKIFCGHITNNQMNQLVPSSGPLSKSRPPKISMHKLTLNAKDRLIFATDGIASTLSPTNGRAFGADRLIECLVQTKKAGPHELRNEVFFQLEQWRSGSPIDRDQTLVALEVEERILKLAKKSNLTDGT